MTALGDFSSGDVLTAADLNAIGTWTTYTPSLTNWSVSAISGKYARINELVIVKISGTVSSVSGTPIFSLPVTAASTNDLEVGNAYLLDSGSNIYFGRVLANTSTSAGVYSMLSTGSYVSYGGINAAVPFTWAANDAIRLQLIYEAA